MQHLWENHLLIIINAHALLLVNSFIRAKRGWEGGGREGHLPEVV